jgi:hypothetical protein
MKYISKRVIFLIKHRNLWEQSPCGNASKMLAMMRESGLYSHGSNDKDLLWWIERVMREIIEADNSLL